MKITREYHHRLTPDAYVQARFNCLILLKSFLDHVHPAITFTRLMVDPCQHPPVHIQYNHYHIVVGDIYNGSITESIVGGQLNANTTQNRFPLSLSQAPDGKNPIHIMNVQESVGRSVGGELRQAQTGVPLLKVP